MSRLHHRVSEIQPEMRDLQAENLLQMRVEAGQIVSHGWPVMRWQCPTCRTEIHALTTDVKNKQLLRALLTCADAHLRQIDEDERMI